MLHVTTYLENSQDDFGDADLNYEFNKANLQVRKVLFELEVILCHRNELGKKRTYLKYNAKLSDHDAFTKVKVF